MLLIDPNYLYDIGFQLSYAAIIGIAIATQFWPTDALKITKPLRYVLETTIVTLGATMGTVIISAFYFHQFPVWFLPANLIAVPLTAVLLPLTLLAIPLSLISGLILPISQVSNELYAFLLGLMEQIAGWPMATVNHIYFDSWQCVGLYLVCALFLSYYLTPNKILAIVLSIASIGLLSYSLIKVWRFNQVREIIIWHNPKTILITQRQNGITTAIATDSLSNYIQQSLNNYAEADVKPTLIAPFFKVRIANKCLHYQTSICDSACYYISSNPYDKSKSSILVYPWVQPKYTGYQTSKNGAFVIPFQ
jgi:competence protein ComEC